LQDCASFYQHEPLCVSSWSYPATGVRPDAPSFASQTRASLLQGNRDGNACLKLT